SNFLEPLMHDTLRNFWPVAFTAEVAQIKMAQLGRHNLLGRFSRRLIRQMTVPAEDPLLKTPGPMRAILQHFHIVVGFQHQHIGPAHTLQHKLRRMTEIGQNADVSGAGPQQESDRILCVVWHTECFHHDVAYFETGPGPKETVVERSPKLELKR